MNSVVSSRHLSKLLLASALSLSVSFLSAQTPPPDPVIADPAADQAAPAGTGQANKNDEENFGETVLLQEFVVSGTVAPRRQLESAAAITTIDLEQMKVSAPIGLPELIKQLPGIFVNSAGGEARSNVYARGLPQAGGLIFVGLQQDGMPDFPEMQFRNLWADLFIRATNFTQRIENVRGGTSGIFQNNVPGGIINLISREGTATPKGEITVQTTDYGQIKTEVWSSGPIAEGTTYAAGISYRRDDGIIDTGYTGNKGYIFQGNVRRDLPNGRGFIKLSAKYVDDSSVFYSAIPMQNTQNPQAIPGGFELGNSTQNSSDLAHVVLPNTPYGDLVYDATDGAHPRHATLSGLFELKLTDGLKLQERARYTDIVYDSATLLTSGVATPLQTLANGLGAASATQFAAARQTNGNYRYRLSIPGENGAVVADPSTLNSNGLGMNLTLSASYTRMTVFQNDLRLIKSLPHDGTLALGLYNSWLDMPKATTVNSTMLMEVTNNPRRLDVEFLDATTGAPIGFATYQGIRQASASAGYRNYSTDQRTVAPFLSLEQPFGNWNFDAGVRHQTKKETLTTVVTKTYNLNAAGQNIPALRNAGFAGPNRRTGSYDLSATAWTAGANYKFSERFSAYGRFTRAYRMPISDDFLANFLAGNTDPGPTNRITSVETGVKYATRKLSIFGTLIGSQLSNQLFSGLVAQPDGSLVTRNVVRDTDVVGAELEIIYTPIRSLSFRFVGTEQRATFANDALVTDPSGTSPAININGNRVSNIPERYFIFSTTYRFPEFRLGKLAADVTWSYTGDNAVDEANRVFVPDYSVFDAGLSFTAGRMSYRLTVKNVADSEALTNGDARSAQVFADPTAAYLNARTVLPRSIVFSATYSF